MSSGVGGGGVWGASAPPKVLICWNLGKMPENLNKIPNRLCKIPENLGKNGIQRCWTSQNGALRLQKYKWRPFLEVIPKTVGTSCTRTFWASLGKFGQKPVHPQKYACSHTYGSEWTHFQWLRKSLNSNLTSIKYTVCYQYQNAGFCYSIYPNNIANVLPKNMEQQYFPS